MDLKTNFNLNDCDLLIDIANIPNPNRITCAEISKYTGINQMNPRLRGIIKYLTDNNILIFIERIGNSKIYKLKRKELFNLLKKQEYVQKWKDKCIDKIYAVIGF